MASTSKSHKSHKTLPQEPGSPESQLVVDLAPPPDLATQPELTTPTPMLTEKSKDSVSTGAPQELEPKTQYWYRTRDSKTFKVFQKIVVMREAGRPDADIAKRLNTTAPNVAQTMWIAKKNGWVDGDGEEIDVEAELAINIDRKVVRNISASLDGGMTNWQTHEMTMAAAKGRGMFKSHEVSKGGGDSQMQVVAIQVVMPPIGAGDQMPEIREDQMGGVPAYVDGEIENVGFNQTTRAGQDTNPSTEAVSLVVLK